MTDKAGSASMLSEHARDELKGAAKDLDVIRRRLELVSASLPADDSQFVLYLLNMLMHDLHRLAAAPNTGGTFRSLSDRRQ